MWLSLMIQLEVKEAEVVRLDPVIRAQVGQALGPLGSGHPCHHNVEVFLSCSFE